MTLLVPAKVLCNVWSYEFSWRDVIHWITAMSYDNYDIMLTKMDASMSNADGN